MTATTGLPQLVLATGNPGKVSELAALLADRFVVERRPSELAETVEDAATLDGNALKKAKEVASHTGLASLADDSGLFVDALDGNPGVHSARYAGPQCNADDNTAKLLRELDRSEALNEEARKAQFRTVIAMVWPDGRQLLAEGSVAGWITVEPIGDKGFGYDPVFAPDEGNGLTFAQMSLDQKQAISHRSRALSALLDQLDARSVEN